MLHHMKIAAVALIATTGVASAATIAGQFNTAGFYTVDNGTTFNIGEMINLAPLSASSSTGDFDGVTMGTTAFSLETVTGGNVGTTFSFGDFLFTIASTLSAALDNVGLEVFGLGTVTGGGFDASEASYRFSAAGAGQNTSASGLYTLFVQAPPEEIEVPPAVPLPAGMSLLLGGLAVFGLARRRRKA